MLTVGDDGLAARLAAEGVGSVSELTGGLKVGADFLRKLLPIILVGLLAYSLAKKNLGQDHQPRDHAAGLP